MATINVRNLSFTYPLGKKKALDGVSFDVSESEFVVICGKSGCGKSTLLRQLKKNLIPFGDGEGEVLYEGTKVADLDDALSTAQIGFVQQNPDNQIVTDKVWHELAFGLESLGLDNQTIKRRVAEMANFFDIQGWFRKDVSELSGGQKQLLNLASVMAMQPKVLILDEPTSQLDPIAASEFLKVVYRINRELGVTVIISEHRLEELFTMADKVMVMDEGKIIAFDTPWTIGTYLAAKHHPMFHGLPSVMRIYSMARQEGVMPYCVNGNEYSPLTIRDGRLWLEEVLGEAAPSSARFESGAAAPCSARSAEAPCEDSQGTESEAFGDAAIEMKDVWFSYGKGMEPVLRGLNLKIMRGEMFCLLGGNGAGKSTTLKAIAGIIQPQDGKISVDGIAVKKGNLKDLFKGHLAMVPQNPQALFTEITVEDELLEGIYYSELSDDEKAQKVNDMLALMQIEHLKDSHPYDLSGGEQQRLALGKILLLDPDVLLLDEPTKGLDPFFKITLAGILKKLTARGVTIFMVSHDIEFCAEYATRCAMFFDGEVASIGRPKPFFAGNSFYTTSANRMARKWFPDAVTADDVADAVKAYKEAGDE